MIEIVMKASVMEFWIVMCEYPALASCGEVDDSAGDTVKKVTAHVLNESSLSREYIHYSEWSVMHTIM